MAINLPSGFKITTTESIDDRLLLTKAQMKSMAWAKMPDKYFCLCKDDSKVYVFSKSITEEDPDVGYFRPIDNYIEFQIPTTEAAKESFVTSVKETISESTEVKEVIAASLKLDGTEIVAKEE